MPRIATLIPSAPRVFSTYGLTPTAAEAVGAGVGHVGPEDREGRLAQDGLEDRAPEVELVVAERHGVVVHGVERLDERLHLERGGERRPVGGVAQRGGLEVVRHRVALDVVAAVEQEGARRVVEPLLLDEGRQLGVADEGSLGQVPVGVVVVEDRDRDDAAAGVGAVADDAPVERPVAVRALVGRRRRPVVGRHVGVDGIEHVAPVRDVLHVLEAVVAVAAGRRQELVGADLVGLRQVERRRRHASSCSRRRRRRRPRRTAADRGWRPCTRSTCT